MIKKWKQFNENISEESILDENEYLKIFTVDNGIKLELTQEGKDFLKDIESEIESELPFIDIFETISNNSELSFIVDLGEAGFGLTSAPGITDGYYYDDDGVFTDNDNDNSRVYYYDNYMIKSFLMELYKGNEIIFNEII